MFCPGLTQESALRQIGEINRHSSLHFDETNVIMQGMHYRDRKIREWKREGKIEWNMFSWRVADAVAADERSKIRKVLFRTPTTIEVVNTFPSYVTEHLELRIHMELVLNALEHGTCYCFTGELELNWWEGDLGTLFVISQTTPVPVAVVDRLILRASEGSFVYDQVISPERGRRGTRSRGYGMQFAHESEQFQIWYELGPPGKCIILSMR